MVKKATRILKVNIDFKPTRYKEEDQGKAYEILLTDMSDIPSKKAPEDLPSELTSVLSKIKNEEE